MMAFLRRMLVWCGIGVAVAAVVLFAMPTYRHGEASIAGKTAEDFSLELAGKPTRLSQLRGKVVVLNFWASWCPPCVEETPSLNKLQQYLAPHNAMVLGVSIDEDPTAYLKFVSSQGVLFQTWRDPNVQGNRSQLALDYGTSMIPETYIIDRHGRIARKVAGPQNWDSPEMLSYFDSLLAQN